MDCRKFWFGVGDDVSSVFIGHCFMPEEHICSAMVERCSFLAVGGGLYEEIYVLGPCFWYSLDGL